MAPIQLILQKLFNFGPLDSHISGIMGCNLSQDEFVTILCAQSTRLQGIDGKPLSSYLHGAEMTPDRKDAAQGMQIYQWKIGKILYVGKMSNQLILYHATS